MKHNFAWLFMLLFLGLLATSCGKKYRYDRWVRQELASGVRHDSLFFGLHLGMRSRQFYAHCWQLNKEGLIRQGNGNTSVLYEMDKELKYPADMNFYPTFYHDSIYEMPVKFNYRAWAPWNKKTWSDSLQQDVLHLYEKWYGKGFMEIDSHKKGKAYVKIDGNRRISIYKAGDQYVWALFTDLAMAQRIQQPDTSNLAHDRQ